MPNSLDIAKRANLVKFGFTQRGVGGTGMMLEGFDNHMVTLYCHTDNPQQLPTIPFRVGNPAQIDNAEADLLNRKMSVGYFPWTRDECLERTYQLEWNAAKEERGMIVPIGKVKGKEQHGCPWCRERQNSIESEGEAVETSPKPDQDAVFSESSASQTSPPSPKAVLESVVCTECGFTANPVSKTGKARSLKQREHTINMHKKAAHRKGVPA